MAASDSKAEIIKTLGRQSLLAYTLACNPAFKTPPHILKLIDALERVERGELKRLQIFMPPQNGKSTIASEFFPCWYFGRHPTHNIGFGTYNGDFATKRGRTVRNMLNTDIHKYIFPEAVLSKDSKSAGQFALAAGGQYKAVGRGKGLTGYSVNGIIIDDPFKDMAEADSATIRQAAKDWYNTVIKTRLKNDDWLIIINTRWHEDDLSGYTLKEHAYENWEVISFPAINENNEALWPEQFSLEYLQGIRQGMPPRQWSALYQQNPIPAEGGMLNLSWYRRYTGIYRGREDLPANKFNLIVQGHDCANKDGKKNDPSACQTWGIANDGIYLLDCWQDRLLFPQLKKKVVELYNQWKPDLVLIEDKQNGTPIIQDLFESTNIPLKAIPKNAADGKEAMCARTSPLVEGGRVWIPDEAPWRTVFDEQVSGFPFVTHDEHVDIQSMILAWYMDRIRRTQFTFKSGGRRTAGSTFNGFNNNG